MVKNGYGQSDHGTLKLTVFQKWTDKITDFLHAGRNSKKTKSWFNDFWVGVVKNGQGMLVHETIKSAAS